MNNAYFHDHRVHNPESAEFVIPIVLDLLKPTNIIDIGCGLGDWLLVAQENGIRDYLGVDSANFDPEKMYIPKEKYKVADLKKPLHIERKFDIAICLEVAEHLPKECGPVLVSTLTNLSDNILFSAAIPEQGGQNHINEQPFQYWMDLFSAHNYQFYDLLRPEIWGNSGIKWWYQQNMFLVSKKKSFNSSNENINTYIHPDLFYKKVRILNNFKQGKESPKVYLSLFFLSLLTKIKRFFPLKNS